MNLREGRFFQDEQFKGLEFTDEVLHSKDFEQCRFVNCNFAETFFESCFFEDCTFENCNLGMVRVGDSTFRNVTFSGSKLIGISWHECRHKGPGVFLAYKNCILDYSSFYGMDLKKCSFCEISAVECDFTESCLAGVTMENVKLSGAVFFRTDLRKADFSQAAGYSFNPHDNLVKGAVFSMPEVLNLLYALGMKIII